MSGSKSYVKCEISAKKKKNLLSCSWKMTVIVKMINKNVLVCSSLT